MNVLDSLLASGSRVGGHYPWPCSAVDQTAWQYAITRLTAGEITLLSLWGEVGRAHMALLAEADDPPIIVLSLDCPDGRYPSVGQAHAPAIRLERAMRDLFGLEPVGLPDTRPWLDHGRWGDATPDAASYPFLPVDGDGLDRPCGSCSGRCRSGLRRRPHRREWAGARGELPFSGSRPHGTGG